jgi:hypothetical protein
MNPYLITRVVVEVIVFFGMSGEDLIDPDAAVSQLEAIATTLKELNSAEREQFLSYVRELAEAEERATGRTPRVEFLLGIGVNLGLA